MNSNSTIATYPKQAVCENVSSLHQTYLEQGIYGEIGDGAITGDFLRRIQRGVQVAIGIYEL